MKTLTKEEFEKLQDMCEFGSSFANDENSKWSEEISPISSSFDEIIQELLRTEGFAERLQVRSSGRLWPQDGKYFLVFRLPEKFAKTYGSESWISPAVCVYVAAGTPTLPYARILLIFLNRIFVF
jgi:hypothetical protein